MLGYLHHALNFLWLNVVKGKSHRANGVVVKSNLVAANIILKRPKLPHQASVMWRGEKPHHTKSRRGIKCLHEVFLSNTHQCFSLRSHFPPAENLSRSFPRPNKSHCSPPKCCNEVWLLQGRFTKPGARL